MGANVTETGFALNRWRNETGVRGAGRIIPRFGPQFDPAMPPRHDPGHCPGFPASGGLSVPLARVSCDL
jgi:hypothetical protein